MSLLDPLRAATMILECKLQVQRVDTAGFNSTGTWRIEVFGAWPTTGGKGTTSCGAWSGAGRLGSC